ncbi:hypothetical protein CPT03_03165 [Pedobacter ginsengisoli]|uniref:Uncharacterized protein n=1 Tax=Pedobacter ginsengisoli TaxID=363852 RepID=A0A2D1U1R6_9SPHI|nr:hypothetical protein CPT03_03165 [Pedobacter ginsengisoli]
MPFKGNSSLGLEFMDLLPFSIISNARKYCDSDTIGLCMPGTSFSGYLPLAHTLTRPAYNGLFKTRKIALFPLSGNPSFLTSE